MYKEAGVCRSHDVECAATPQPRNCCSTSTDKWGVDEKSKVHRILYYNLDSFQQVIIINTTQLAFVSCAMSLLSPKSIVFLGNCCATRNTMYFYIPQNLMQYGNILDPIFPRYFANISRHGAQDMALQSIIVFLKSKRIFEPPQRPETIFQICSISDLVLGRFSF